MDAELKSMLDRADELTSHLEDEYKNCLQIKRVTHKAQNLTHEVLEKLRNTLDHAMFKAWDKHVSPNLSEKDRNRKRKQVYFPIANNSSSLQSTLGKGGMKDLDKVHKELYDFVLKKQPLSSKDNNWLDLLAKISAEGKHVKLAPQRLIEIPQSKISKPEAGSVPSDPFSVKFSEGKEKWIAFVLEDYYGFNALALCKELSQKTRALVEEMVDII
jgi:hypothetical protein